MASSPRVAIVGAGPSGCTLALLLLQSSIPCTIYEGEAAIGFRSQGGTLDLHPSTGLKALKECNLLPKFQDHARYDGEALKVMDKNLNMFLQLPGTKDEKSSRGRPEIDRGMLRKILVDALPEGIIQWNKHVVSVQENTTADSAGPGLPMYTLVFKDGSSVSNFDLLVGADGAWSKVRAQLSDTHPRYYGIGGFDLLVPDAATTYPELSKLVNRGSLFTFSDGKGVTLQQKEDKSVSCYIWGTRPEGWMKEWGVDVHDPKAVKEHLRQYLGDWQGPLGGAAQRADETTIVARNLYVLPVGHSWKHKSGITCMGDAAHLTTPFAGEGVNLAMEDALELAYAIRAGTKDTQTLDANIKSAEERMFARATPIQGLSERQGEVMFFEPGGPGPKIATWIRNSMGGPNFDKWWLQWLLPDWFLVNVLSYIFSAVAGVKLTPAGEKYVA